MPDVIGQVTLQAGRVTHPPGSVVTIEDLKEAKRLVEAGDAVWADEEHIPEAPAGSGAEAAELQPVAGRDANPLAGVNFASDEAAEAAAELALKAGDFEGWKGSGRAGAFTKGDVTAIAKELDEEEDE